MDFVKYSWCGISNCIYILVKSIFIRRRVQGQFLSKNYPVLLANQIKVMKSFFIFNASFGPDWSRLISWSGLSWSRYSWLGPWFGFSGLYQVKIPYLIKNWISNGFIFKNYEFEFLRWLIILWWARLIRLKNERSDCSSRYECSRTVLKYQMERSKRVHRQEIVLRLFSLNEES